MDTSSELMLAFIKSFYKVKLYKWCWWHPWVVGGIIKKMSYRSFQPLCYLNICFYLVRSKSPVFTFSFKQFYFIYRSIDNCFRFLSRCWSCWLYCWSCWSCWNSGVFCVFSVSFSCVSVCSWRSVEVCLPSVNINWS